MSRSRAVVPFASVAMIVLVGCEQPSQPTPPPPVVIAKPVVREVQSQFETVGTTAATEDVAIRARVTGYLETIEFTPGELVEKGQLLFTIQAQEIDARVGQAQALVTIQTAELERAESDLERVQKVETEAVSKQEIDRRQAERDKAAGSLEAAEAELEAAQLDLAYTTISSPIAGRVGRNLVTVGNLVGPGGQTTLLTSVVAQQPIYVYFDVPERILLRVLRDHVGGEIPARRRPVAVSVEDDEGFVHEGEIDFVDNQVDQSTGTIEVRAILPNEDSRLVPGLFARVRVPGKPLPDAVLVETTAIGTDLGGKFVLVIGEGNIVERRYVEPGDEFEDLRVVLSGLEPGVDYIVEGLNRARPGLPVRPMTREQFAQTRQQQQQQEEQGG